MLEVRYEWNFPIWAVRRKPTATGILHPPRSYLDPNSGSLQKPIGGRSLLTQKPPNSMLKTHSAFFGAIYSIYKGAIDCSKRKRSNQKMLCKLHFFWCYYPNKVQRVVKHYPHRVCQGYSCVAELLWFRFYHWQRVIERVKLVRQCISKIRN